MNNSHKTITLTARLVKATIDGKLVQTPEGSTVLDAARQAGIYIPAVCSRPDLYPFPCNLCIVDIEGKDGFSLACKTPVTEDMVVLTETPRLRALRRKYLKRILAVHPSGCLECQRLEPCDGSVCGRKVPYEQRCVNCKDNEHCELQTAARYILREEVLLPYGKRDFMGLGIQPPTTHQQINEDGYPDQSTLLLSGG